MEHHRAGRLREAEESYKRIIASDPRHVDALHLLGTLYQNTHRMQDAIDTFTACYQDRLDILEAGLQVWVKKR